MPVPPIQLVNPNNERRRQPDVLDPMHFINRSDDIAEMRAARDDDRPPNYTGS